MTISSLFAISHYLSGVSVPFANILHTPWHVIFTFNYQRLIRFFTLSVAYFFFVYLLSGLLNGFSSLGDSLKYFLYFISFHLPLVYNLELLSLIQKVSRSIFKFFLLLSVLQYFSLLVPLENIIQVFIPKFHGGPWGDGSLHQYRGVSLLEAEPARASYVFLLTFLIAFWNSSSNVIKKYFLIMFVVQVFFIKSTTGILLTFMSSFLFFNFSIRRFLIFIVSILVILPSSYFLNKKINSFVDLLLNQSIYDAFYGLSKVSGGRIETPIYGIERIVSNYFYPQLTSNTTIPQLITLNDSFLYGLVNNIPSGFLHHLLIGGIIYPLFIFFILYKKNLVLSFRPVALILFLGCLYTPSWSPLLLIFFMISLNNQRYKY